MKLIIQIPCYNEEETLGEALSALPREIPGVSKIERLVINDGSRDRTLEVAREAGVEHIIDLAANMGLASAFKTGLARAIAEGADIIINTDADNQYDARDIPKLVEPILKREAEFVVGARSMAEIKHFSWMKRILNHLGSWVVRFSSGTDIRDAPSGFRAISREAALRINVFDGYTYTLESIIQAGLRNIRVISVPIRINGPTRPSRLIRSTFHYVLRSGISILRTLLVYRPGKTLLVLGSLPLVVSLILGIRWIILLYSGTERTHVPSLVVAAALFIIGMLTIFSGLIGEILQINRILLEDIQYHLRRERLPRALRAERTKLSADTGA